MSNSMGSVKKLEEPVYKICLKALGKYYRL
jgi:hypothetical protein